MMVQFGHPPGGVDPFVFVIKLCALLLGSFLVYLHTGSMALSVAVFSLAVAIR